MRIIFFALFFLLFSSSFAQGKKYRPLYKLGWESEEFSTSWMTETDTGRVVYLLQVDDAGRINSIEILDNTFAPRVEKQLAMMVQNIELKRSKSRRPKKLTKGTYEIDRRRCADVGLSL